MSSFHVVTGAFGYSGSRIAQRLLDRGVTVRTLTGSPRRESPLAGHIEVRDLAFDRPEELAESLRGAEVLYNTYWVRFGRRGCSHAQAVRHTQTLFAAARRAGVGRVVHVSITHADESSPLPYFAGKGRLERALIESGLPHTILRPAVLFGGRDILINNIAWALRRLPVFGVFGDGAYRLQPIHVDDFASLAVEAGLARQHAIVQAIGPETFTYRQLIQTLARAIGVHRPIVSVPPMLGHAACWALGWLVRDVVITRQEIAGLMAGLLCVDAPPAGPTRLTAWAAAHADELGRRYASELARRRDRVSAYGA